MKEHNEGLVTIREDWQPTKTGIELMASNFLRPLEEGTIEPEAMALLIDAMKKTIEKVEKAARPQIAAHLHSRYAKGEQIDVRGCKIERMEAGVKYDYTFCGDGIWQELKAQEAELSEKIKEREGVLKAIKPGGNFMCVHPDTGELMELRSPEKTSTESYKIKYPEI